MRQVQNRTRAGALVARTTLPATMRIERNTNAARIEDRRPLSGHAIRVETAIGMGVPAPTATFHKLTASTGPETNYKASLESLLGMIVSVVTPVTAPCDGSVDPAGRPPLSTRARAGS
jgi:hypothetical protein